MYKVTVSFPDQLQANAFAVLFEGSIMAELLNPEFEKLDVPPIEDYSTVTFDHSTGMWNGGHEVEVQ